MGFVVIFVYFFFKFGWVYWFFNYCIIFFGLLLMLKYIYDDGVVIDCIVEWVIEFNIFVGKYFNVGFCGIFLLIGYIGWFLSFLFLIVLMVFVIGVFVCW